MQRTTIQIVDPYREWLDVRVPDRPLNAYQLLGLDPGAADEAAIEEAVRHKRELLRGCVQLASPFLWRHLHLELNEAVETLREPRKKADYDRILFPAGLRAIGQQPQGPIACGACAEVNPPTRSFCSGCGSPLLQGCAHCGAKNLSREAFCGICGTNLKAALQAHVDKFQSRLHEAEKLQAEGCFDEALVLLSGMLSTSIPQLEERVSQATEMLRRLPERQSRAQHAYADDLERAEAFLDSCDYETAVTLLEAAPPGLRTEEYEGLYQRCRALRDEAFELAREIREDVAAKRTGGLLEKVERLLVLKPHHAQAAKLKQQLAALEAKSQAKAGETLRVQARELLTEGKYAEAARLLDETPDLARDEEFQKIHEFAKETHWLASALRSSPVVDQGLVAAAQRLCKLAPRNEQAAKAAAEIEAAFKKGPSDPRHAAPVWKPPALRYPIIGLGGFQRLRPTENCDKAILRERPGVFYVACGLALQGLERAAAPINLLGKKKKGVLDAINRFGRKPAPPAAAWGIDATASGLKAVRLVRAANGDAVEIDAAFAWECDFTQAPPPGEDGYLKGLRAALEEFMDGRTLGDDRVCVAVAGIQTLGRFLRLPTVDAAKLPELVTFEVRHQIPVPLDELAWDFHAFPPRGNSNDDAFQECEAAVVAAKQWQLKAPLGAFAEAGVEVHAVQSDCVALYNFLRYELEGEFPDEDSAACDSVIAVVDIGREATSFLACSPSSLFFRTFLLGGDSFTKALVREFNLTLGAAEALKRTPWKSRSMYRWEEALLPVFRNLVDEIVRSEKMLGRGRGIDRLYVTGGGARLHGLLRRLGAAAAEK